MSRISQKKRFRHPGIFKDACHICGMYQKSDTWSNDLSNYCSWNCYKKGEYKYLIKLFFYLTGFGLICAVTLIGMIITILLLPVQFFLMFEAVDGKFGMERLKQEMKRKQGMLRKAK